MPDLITRADLYAIGRNYVRSRAKKIDPSVIDVEGSDANLVVGGTSFMAAACVNQLGYASARMFLDGCEGDDLDRWAFDRYQLLRKGASPARTTVALSRVTTTAGAGIIPAGTRIGTLTGIEYITTAIAPFGINTTVSSVKVRAVQAGKATQVGAHALAKFSVPQLIFDSTISVDNPAPSAGGEDKEDDDLFKGRIRSFWRNARRGTLGAIEQGALSVPGVVSARAIEAVTTGGLPARVVNLFFGDSSGVASDALGEDVRVELEEWRAGGITVLLWKSIPLSVDIALRLQFIANVDTATLTENIRNAIVVYVNSLPVNGTLSRGQLYSVLQRYESDGLIVNEGMILTPTGDLVPSVGQTIRITPENVTVVL